jgi:hypothetical protein
VSEVQGGDQELQRKMGKVDLSVQAVLPPPSFTASYVLSTLPMFPLSFCLFGTPFPPSPSLV